MRMKAKVEDELSSLERSYTALKETSDNQTRACIELNDKYELKVAQTELLKSVVADLKERKDEHVAEISRLVLQCRQLKNNNHGVAKATHLMKVIQDLKTANISYRKCLDEEITKRKSAEDDKLSLIATGEAAIGRLMKEQARFESLIACHEKENKRLNTVIECHDEETKRKEEHFFDLRNRFENQRASIEVYQQNVKNLENENRTLREQSTETVVVSKGRKFLRGNPLPQGFEYASPSGYTKAIRTWLWDLYKEMRE
jgi:chromosome segregation ATPase